MKYVSMWPSLRLILSGILADSRWQLHFSNPQTYHEIYNASNRWNKEETLYHSFGEDRSSFGFLEYKDAKERKDVLSPMFSKKAIQEAQGLVQEKASHPPDHRLISLTLTWA